jgi:hypothetical protein
MAMRILRHAQIDVTMNVYTEVSDAKTLQALNRLGDSLARRRCGTFRLYAKRRPLPAWGSGL